MGLEQQLRDLAVKHDLTSISVGIIHRSDGTYFPNISVQGGGKCALAGSRSDTVTAALSQAIADLQALRSVLVDVPQLEEVA